MKSNQALGSEAEKKVLMYYRKHGYTILEQNWKYFGSSRGQKCEIDIIATKKALLVFIEVKLRRNFEDAAYSIHYSKKQYLTLATHLFLQQYSNFSHFAIRWDAAFVVGDRVHVMENILFE